jgi:hypothetical protein
MLLMSVRRSMDSTVETCGGFTPAPPPFVVGVAYRKDANSPTKRAKSA